MPRSADSALKSDSLAFALHAAAAAIAAVIAGSSLTEALARCWREHAQLAPAARGAIQDLAYSALRQFGRGDFFLSRLMESPLRNAQVHALLLAALARLEARPEEAHTIVDQAVAAAGAAAQGKYKALANAVLRNFMRRRAALLAEAEADEVARWLHPRWWMARLKREYPDDWQAILAAGNMHPPMALRVNARRIAPAAYLARLEEAGSAARSLGGAALLLERPLPVERLPGFGNGLCSVQDAGAQRAALLLDAHDGMRVLDACAAPGGKTAHILELADVDLLALDADAGRALRVSENLLRLGLPARVVPADCREVDAWWDGRPFDRILADVPCSASGVARRHPDIKWLRREADIAKFARTQAEILDALWRVLAPGGKLLYATCSLFPEENGRQVAAFAARQEDCMRLPLEGDSELHLLPTEEHDGFYYALLQKLD
jgi:16S rRNA (cytosine967-C5)-methyltransferase